MNGFSFNPDQMKMAADMMKNMKDDDLKRMMGNMGMGNMDPSLIKNFAANMGGGGSPGGQSQQQNYSPRDNTAPVYRPPEKEEPKKEEEITKVR